MSSLVKVSSGAPQVFFQLSSEGGGPKWVAVSNRYILARHALYLHQLKAAVSAAAVAHCVRYMTAAQICQIDVPAWDVGTGDHHDIR